MRKFHQEEWFCLQKGHKIPHKNPEKKIKFLGLKTLNVNLIALFAKIVLIFRFSFEKYHYLKSNSHGSLCLCMIN